MPRLSLPIRRIPSSVPTTKEPDVFANSLHKTLEAHRSSNRASLIRKVYPRAPSPGLFRPWILPENRAGYQPPAPTPIPTLEDSEIKKVKSEERRRNRTGESKLQSKDDRPGPGIICTADPSIYDPLGQRPWLRYIPPSQATGDAFAYLDAEIRALGSYLAPSPEEQSQVTRINTEVISLLETKIPSPPKLFGPHRMGLALAHSNLDFLIPFTDLSRSPDRTRMPSATRPQIQDAHTKLLRQVRSALQSTPTFNGKIWLHTKSARMQARHQPTGLKLRFVCGENVPAIIEYLQDYMVEYPALRPLYFGIRALLEARGLYWSSHANVSSHAGIENNALLMLLVAFLKMNHGRFTGPNALGYQFIAFLKLYGTGVDLCSVGVAVDPPGFFDNKTLRATNEDAESAYRRGQRSLMSAKRNAVAKGNLPAARRLCIQDPTHFMKDLGRSCIRTTELQGVFKTAYEQLSEALEKWEGPSEDSSILATALRATFDGFEERRRQTTRGRRLTVGQRPINYV